MYPDAQELLTIVLVSAIFWAIAGIIVYYDAAARGHDPACVWGCVVFLFGAIPLFIYFIYRLMNKPERRERRYEPSSTYTPPGGYQSREPAIKADSGYFDPELDRLIDERKFSEARAYLREMLQMAREMGDLKGQANLGKYESKINQAARGSGKFYR